MNSRKHTFLFVGAILFAQMVSTVNYYEFIGLSPSASKAAIRDKCAGVDAIRRKKSELEGARAKKPAPNERIVALEKEVARLVRMGRLPDFVLKAAPPELKKACDVLRDPKEKAKLDAALPTEDEAKAKPYLAVVWKGKSYYSMFTPSLPKDANSGEISRTCKREKAKWKRDIDEARKKLPPNYQKIDSVEVRKQVQAFEIMQKKSSFVEEACTTLLDPKKRAEYDKKKEPTDELGAIRSAVTSAKSGVDVLLVDLVGNFLTKIPIPDAAGTIFNQKLAMRNMQILEKPFGSEVRVGIGFTGTMFFNNLAVQATVYVVRDLNKKTQYSLSVALPEYYKISNMFSQFKKLDRLSLPRGKFVVSTFDYYDVEGFGVKRGFNFVASLELTGPLAMINKLKNQAKKMKSVIVRADPIFFQGVIPRDIKKTAFSAKIPLYIGVDFAKIPKMPKSIKSIFKEITTDDFEFAVTAPQLVFTIEGGVRLVLATQREPIRLSMFGRLERTSFSLGMRMRNMLELKWFALGNAGIQLDFDEALLPAAAVFGIPFTGIGLNGQVELGKKGEARAVLNLAGGARVSSAKIPDLVFDAEAKNIRLAHIINLASKIAVKTKIAKREIPVGNLPVMNLEWLRGYLSLEDTTIAQKEYQAGFAVEVETLILKRRAGFSIDFKHTTGTVSGAGYVSNIDVRAANRKIFSLTGPPFVTKAGKTVEGPNIAFDFDFKKPTEGMFGVDGIFEVPAIDLKHQTHFVWRGWTLDATFETTYMGFTVVFGANIDLKEGQQDIGLPDLEGEPEFETPSVKKEAKPTKQRRWRGSKATLPGFEEKKVDTKAKVVREAAPPGKWRTMMLKFGFKGDFAKFLSKQAVPALKKLQARGSTGLGKLNEEIGRLSQRVKELGKKGEEATATEIKRVQAIIAEIKGKIEAFKKERRATKGAAQKSKITVQISAQRIALGVKQVYLRGLLKPGKMVIKGTTTAVASASNALHKAQLLKKTVEKVLTGFSNALTAISKGLAIFHVTEAIGEYSAQDIRELKLPLLVSLVAETNIPGLPKLRVSLSNLQFDFKRIGYSVSNIAEQLLMGGIRFSKSDKDLTEGVFDEFFAAD